jgi:DNA-binding GntR family transcriptional regulator
MDYKALAANVENREGFGTQEWVYRVLRAGIVNGALPGGMQLKQDEISAALNVSHIPVREALRQLEAQHLVTIHANRGATVTELSREMLINTMQVRAAISIAMLKIAVPRMTEEDFQALDAILEEERKTTETIATENLNIRFHEVLIAKANNPVADMLMEIIHANIDRYLRTGFYSDAADRENSVVEHERILAACKAGNVAEAVELLYAHIMDAAALIPETVQ